MAALKGQPKPERRYSPGRLRGNPQTEKGAWHGQTAYCGSAKKVPGTTAVCCGTIKLKFINA
ncbi:MAG: hypothetical protein LBP76_10450, partial [Treponema sp.]|nr:hypothetical protein [Treponema sp.]